MLVSGGLLCTVLNPSDCAKAGVELDAEPDTLFVVDCRVNPRESISAYLKVRGQWHDVVPVVLVGHRHEPALDKLAAKLASAHTVYVADRSYDAVGSMLSSFVRKAASAVRSEAPPESVGGAGAPAETGGLVWTALYDDSGMLDREVALPADQVGARPFTRAPEPERLERRLSRSQITSMLQDFVEAKPLKPNVQLALRIARDSTATVEDIARVIKQDQALAARVLQMANSSLHRRGAPTRTIESAIIRLGMSAIREMISGTAVLEQFGGDDDTLNFAHLWEHGYAVGMLSADLARATRACAPEDAFMTGLLHDMGRAIMAQRIGRDYIDALLTARRHDMHPSRVEKATFELNHADVAEVIFARWDFDSHITAPVANHHLSRDNLKHLDPVHIRQTGILQAANTLAHTGLLGDSGSDWIDPRMLDVGNNPLAPAVVRTSIYRAGKTIEELRLIMASTPGLEPASDTATKLRDHLPDDITLGGLPSLEAVDPMELLAWRLGTREGVESHAPIGGPYGPKATPDVVLASVGDIQQSRALADLLDAMDTRGPVPAVISCGDPSLLEGDKSPLANRPLHVLPGEFRVSWVVRGINEVLAGAGAG